MRENRKDMNGDREIKSEQVIVKRRLIDKSSLLLEGQKVQDHSPFSALVLSLRNFSSSLSNVTSALDFSLTFMPWSLLSS